MNLRNRLSHCVLAGACVLLLAAPLAAKPKKPPTNDFLLRASAASIESIAARNGLEVLEVVEASADALGRSVYLVRGPLGLAPSEVVRDVGEYEPEAASIEEVFLASLPESDEGADLNQSTVAILSWLSDPTEVEFGRDASGLPRSIWGAYVAQPAAQLLNVDGALDEVSDNDVDSDGNRTIVAIIDTGIDPDHPLYAHRLVPGYDFVNERHGFASEWTDLLDQSTVAILSQSTVAILSDQTVQPLNQSTVAILSEDQASALDPADLPPSFGHGTMVAGIVHRVAPQAYIMPLKAFDAYGNGNLFDIVRAIYFAVDNGASVIHMSFGLEVFSAELMRALSYAARNGVTAVASTGNTASESLVFPAGLGSTIGVASTDYEDYLSSFSNHGRDITTVAAPGENILTTYPGGGWALASGTSFAAPWISGAAALFEKKIKGASDYYFASSALSWALPVHGVEPGDAGFGRADLAAAMQRLQKPE